MRVQWRWIKICICDAIMKVMFVMLNERKNIKWHHDFKTKDNLNKLNETNEETKVNHIEFYKFRISILPGYFFFTLIPYHIWLLCRVIA